MAKEKFKTWLIRNDYAENTSTSYSYAIDKISKHLSKTHVTIHLKKHTK
jgi:hypothetical protein